MGRKNVTRLAVTQIYGLMCDSRSRLSRNYFGRSKQSLSDCASGGYDAISAAAGIAILAEGGDPGES